MKTMAPSRHTPTDEDQLRREYGQQFVKQNRNLTLDLGADFPFATPDVPLS
jgi:hypothetical protein